VPSVFKPSRRDENFIATPSPKKLHDPNWVVFVSTNCMEHSERICRLARVYRPFRTPNDTHAAQKGNNTTGMGVAHSHNPKTQIMINLSLQAGVTKSAYKN